MKRHYAFAGAVALQCVILAAMGARPALSVSRDTRVTLPVVPVDPMDLFRGEYVRLGYDISRLDTTQLNRTLAPQQDRPFFLRLENRNGAWVPTDLQASVGKAEPGAVWLRGRCTSPGDTLTATYGIEQFFVQQGRGREIEDAIRGGTVQAEFAVAEDGTATLTALIVNGKRME
ncbi:MAG: GDYXXLXY domain-containing protein [Planctomycetes bacterium]|nr:GDYXXLXY domain-containing protein [Planctomycetota bacterium]